MPDRDFGSNDNWYDYLTSVKDTNAQRVRNSVQEPSSGGRNAVVSPTPEEPSKVESFKEAKERQAETRYIDEEVAENKQEAKNALAMKQAKPILMGLAAYLLMSK
jgi:hypothetical protein